MANDFSTGKSIFILAIVAGCFAILWPNIFYPMLVGSYEEKNGYSSGGCCDVMFDRDMNAIKIMTQLCEKILGSQDNFHKKFMLDFEQGKLTKEIVVTCQQTVLEKCNIDITEFLKEKVRLGRSYKHMLDEIRSLNSSLCLKQNFGISMGQIGLPRHMRVWGVNVSKHLKQERPPHLRPDLMHPALREKGRAIPQSHVVPKVTVQEGRPGPIPGLRPPMGGAGHVVPPPKGSGTMGIVMPMYTIGIVVFFLYTMMKLMFKKSDEPSSYDGFISDPDFRRAVFENTSHHQYVKNKEVPDDGSKLVVSAISGLIQEVNRQIRQDQAHPLPQSKDGQAEEVTDAIEDKVLPISDTNENAIPETVTEIPEDDSETKGGSVKVVGMEMTESVEGGAKWSRPPTPLSRPSTPQNIYLPGSVPSQSQLLVSDSHTETQSEDNSVVLTGKVTLSLIGLLEKETKEESYITETVLEPKPDLNIETKDDQDKEENKVQEKAILKKDGDSSIKEN